MSGSLVVPTQALWTWTLPVAGQAQQVQSYPTVPGNPTKSGLIRSDLEAFIGIPIQGFATPPQEIADSTVNQWIRWAEDDIESDTNVRLCQTWIAAPPTKTQQVTQLVNLGVQGLYQQLGVDYDLAEAGYDFVFERWRDEGWGYMRLRWRPVKSVEQFDDSLNQSNNLNGTKNVAFIYPLLNEFFRMPPSWIVEDQNRGLIRFVPAISVQMLPLFAMQLSFMGFSQSVPQGLWFQYNAGLTPNDYNSEWSFMQQLILCKAAVIAFQNLQTPLAMGAMELTSQIDGLMRRVRYSEKGAFSPQIETFGKRADALLRRAKSKAGGIPLGSI